MADRNPPRENARKPLEPERPDQVAQPDELATREEREVRHLVCHSTRYGRGPLPVVVNRDPAFHEWFRTSDITAYVTSAVARGGRRTPPEAAVREYALADVSRAVVSPDDEMVSIRRKGR